MDNQVTVLIRSSASAAQACMPSVLHASTGGTLCKVSADEDRSEHQDKVQMMSTASALEDLYFGAMSSKRGAIFDVPSEHRHTMVKFINDKRGLLNELKNALVCTSPDAASQDAARETLEALLLAGILPPQIQLLFIDAPENSSIDVHYPTVIAFAREVNIAVSPDATLTASPVFEKVHQLQMPISAVLNRAVDFEVELTTARSKDASEKIRLALAAKVMAQRSLLAEAASFERIVDAIGLPRISKEDWRAELTTNRKRMF